MAPKIFIDINTLVDFFDSAREQHQQAKALLQNIEMQIVDGYVSESVLNTVAYLVQKNFTPKDIKTMLQELLSIVTLLPCNNDIYRAGLAQPGSDIEDGILYELATMHEMNFFITSDKKMINAYKHLPLPVLTAAQFLKKLTA
ncbi:MAG: type II toxin-antitoxin system VapC family toxin [Dinghuibacter sp.]|nr:type II toxin-antitoxin system VapC family toxin [Dinghuibacter sp.]